MRAAVVTEFGTPPICREFAEPQPGTSDEVLVDVVAAGLHPRVRSQADGSHYTESGELPLVPGIDGVGRAPDGTLRYFVLPDTSMGAMAERTVVDTRRSVVLPEDADPVLVAAGMNPAMSAWVALRRRIEFAAGQDVLVLGATGNAGRLAVQVAKHLGAGRVIAAGRDAGRLADVPADEALTFDELGKAADVDVVLDYVWGPPTAEALRTIVTERSDRGRPLTWVEIGSVAGRTIELPLGRAPSGAPAARRQRPRFGPDPGHRRGAARLGEGDRHLPDRRARGAPPGRRNRLEGHRQHSAPRRHSLTFGVARTPECRYRSPVGSE
jgi:hypothetical protein